MKILVTGVAGFIGSYMAGQLLDNNHEVIGIDNYSDYYDVNLKKDRVKDLENRGMKFLQADLAEDDWQTKLSSNINYIFHFAAQPGISSAVPFKAYEKNNILATQHLILFAHQQNELKLFVNISTSSVYGLEATKNETAVPEPASWYGVTKLAAEQLVMSEARLKKLNACSLRLYSVYGPGERPDKLYTKLINCIETAEAFNLYEGSLQHQRSFTYVGDICNGILSVMGKESLVNGELINLGSDQQYSTAEGIAFVEDLMQKKVQINMLPARTGDQKSTKAIINKAKDLLGYVPETSLKEGLALQIRYALKK